jgi:hypothetical protein
VRARSRAKARAAHPGAAIAMAAPMKAASGTATPA